MSNRAAPESISLSYLNAIEYCPRRFYYEFVQGDMLENEFVLEGTLLHQRADQPGQHTTREGEIQINHLYLYSEALRLSGFADVVEEERSEEHTSELQSQSNLVCRLLLEKKNKKQSNSFIE